MRRELHIKPHRMQAASSQLNAVMHELAREIGNFASGHRSFAMMVSCVHIMSCACTLPELLRVSHIKTVASRTIM